MATTFKLVFDGMNEVFEFYPEGAGGVYLLNAYGDLDELPEALAVDLLDVADDWDRAAYPEPLDAGDFALTPAELKALTGVWAPLVQ